MTADRLCEVADTVIAERLRQFLSVPDEYNFNGVHECILTASRIVTLACAARRPHVGYLQMADCAVRNWYGWLD